VPDKDPESLATAIDSDIKEFPRDVAIYAEETSMLLSGKVADPKMAVPPYSESLFKREQSRLTFAADQGFGSGLLDRFSDGYGFARYLATSDPTLLRIEGLFRELEEAAPLSPLSSFEVYEGVTLTSDHGFALTVIEAAELPLSVYRGQPDLRFSTGVFTEYQIQPNVFAHTEADAVVRLRLTQADGQSLPTWVQFNGKTGKLLINPPDGFTGDLVLRLVAFDQAGHEVVTIFQISIREPAKPQEGRMGFTDKIKDSMETFALGFLGQNS
jgi:hypothetical protein